MPDLLLTSSPAMDRLSFLPLPPAFLFGEFQLEAQEGVRVYEGSHRVGGIPEPIVVR